MSAPPPPAPPQAASPPTKPSAPTEPASAAAPPAPGADAGTPTEPPPTFQWPLPSDYTNILSGFGERTNPKDRTQRQSHEGIDLPAPEGTDIYAAGAGRVAVAKEVGGYGNAIYLAHGDVWSTRYAHCSELISTAGQSVKTGDLIAKVGKTGNVTGPHLHFEVRENGTARNPEDYLQKPEKP